MNTGRDIGNYIMGAFGGASSTSGASAVTIADSPNDAVEVTGGTIDRLQPQGTALSAVVLIPYSATLSEDKTISFTVKMKDSANGSSWANEVTLQSATVAATGGVGGSEETGIVDINVDLSSYRRYIQINITPDLSQADIPEVPDPDGAGPEEGTPAVPATDQAAWACAVVLGGFKSFAV
jgi:hypothetical protein